jgi:hypothetical protein
MKISCLRNFIAATSLAASALMFVSPAPAANVARTSIYATGKGASGTVSSLTSRGNATAQIRGSWTNTASGTGTFEAQRGVIKATRTSTDTRVAAGSSGKKPVITASSGKGIARTVTTLPNGQTATRGAPLTQTIATAPAN